MATDRGYVYILASGFKHIYTGVTAKLPERIREHKMKIHPRSFTAKYNIDQPVYSEEHVSIVKAIAREKQIKGWLRIKKIQLIKRADPKVRPSYPTESSTGQRLPQPRQPSALRPYPSFPR